MSTNTLNTAMGSTVNSFDFNTVVNLFLTWYDRATTRSSLAGMEDHLLQDIGIDRATALEEAAKPVWVQ